MARKHNFSAGPAVLPVTVLEELRDALLEYGGTGLGLMEMSHRGKAFTAIIEGAEARLRRVLGVPADYKVLFLQGGASLQFYMVPLNLLRGGEAADFLVTGTWASKAIKEAARIGDTRAAWDGKSIQHRRVPGASDYEVRREAVYLHYCSNNTIYGTQFPGLPDAQGHHLVADMSSDIASRPVDVAAHDVIFAGAQKNLGPSGVTVVILSPWAMERCAGGHTPMLDYLVQAAEGSMFNTPNTFGIYALERVLAWVEDIGGLPAIASRNTAKADALYEELDRSDFWRPHAERGSRSQMNVTWRLPSEEAEARFLSEAEAAGFKGLKGHRSVGGVRASLYNALEPGSVHALVGFMREFEAKAG
jgi:phosphoserine aminotransferase